MRAIIRYISRDSPARARSFARELRNKTLPLARSPELGRTDRPNLPAGFRELVIDRNYIAIYRILADAAVIEIVRIKHVAQQAP